MTSQNEGHRSKWDFGPFGAVGAIGGRLGPLGAIEGRWELFGAVGDRWGPLAAVGGVEKINKHIRLSSVTVDIRCITMMTSRAKCYITL